jgi:hypothetical protein
MKFGYLDLKTNRDIRSRRKSLEWNTENCKTILMSLLSHQEIPNFSTQQDLSNRVSITWGTPEQKLLYHFKGKYLVIHLYVTSGYPQQLIRHFLKSKLEQAESLINNQNFLKRVRPHRTTGSKVTK